VARSLEEILASGGNPRTNEELELLGLAALETIQRQLRPEAAHARQIYDDWSKKEYWTAIEAATLGIGINPLLELIQYMRPDDATKFHKLLDLIRRKFGDRIRPAELLDWSRKNDIAIENDVIEAIEKRIQPPPSRPQDVGKLEKTAAKMLVAMAFAKYGYKRKSDNAVAESIAASFQDIESGMSLSKNAIISQLRRALDENGQLQQALERKLNIRN
jgi:hypothetical protein